MAVRKYTDVGLRNTRRSTLVSKQTASRQYITGGVSTYADAIQSLARRYGKKKKRKFRLAKSKIRPPVLGAFGSAEQATEEVS